MASKKSAATKTVTPRKRRKKAGTHPIWGSPRFMPGATAEHRKQYRDTNVAREKLEQKWEAIRQADGGGLSEEHCREYWAELAAWREEYQVDPPAKELNRDSIETLDELREWAGGEQLFAFMQRQFADTHNVSAEDYQNHVHDTALAAVSAVRVAAPSLPALPITKDMPPDAILNEVLIWLKAPPVSRWSPPHDLNYWRIVFGGVSKNTMIKHFKQGKFLNRKIGELYQVAIHDVPIKEE